MVTIVEHQDPNNGHVHLCWPLRLKRVNRDKSGEHYTINHRSSVADSISPSVRRVEKVFYVFYTCVLYTRFKFWWYGYSSYTYFKVRTYLWNPKLTLEVAINCKPWNIHSTYLLAAPSTNLCFLVFFILLSFLFFYCKSDILLLIILLLYYATDSIYIYAYI